MNGFFDGIKSAAFSFRRDMNLLFLKRDHGDGKSAATCIAITVCGGTGNGGAAHGEERARGRCASDRDRSGAIVGGSGVGIDYGGADIVVRSHIDIA